MKHLAKTNVPAYLKVKRSKKTFNYTRRQQRILRKASEGRLAMYQKFGHESKVLRLLSASHSVIKKRPPKGKITFVVPQAFSIMENAAEVLKAIQCLAGELLAPRVKWVVIDMSQVTSYDLGANALLDVVVEEAITKARKTGRRIRWSGKYPKKTSLRRTVKAMGVIKRLEILHEYPDEDEARKLVVFDDRCKDYVRAVRLNETDRKSRTTQKFADHVNKCLSHIGKKLTESARHKLCKYIAEVLDNAEEHSGMYEWTIQGYLDTNLEEFVCEIVIFNVGDSIFETFNRLQPENFTRKIIQPYLDAHESGSLFVPGWRREDLVTLIALQGGVSSKNDGTTERTRGNGSADLIEFFQLMHREQAQEQIELQAKMALISGSTRVYFDGKYEMAKDQSGRPRIAFNQENDLRKRPDGKYVAQLSGVSFPGTILSIKFPLAKRSTATAGAQV